MAETKDLHEVLADLLDKAVVEKFNDEGWFDKINEMSLNGMLSLLVTIAWGWMEDRVKEVTPLSVRYEMADTFGKVVKDMLTDTIKEKYAK